MSGGKDEPTISRGRRPGASAERARSEPGSGAPRSPIGGWAIAAVLVAAAVMVYAIRYALLPFVFAIAIAFVADPAVVRLSRLAGGRRWPGALVLWAAIAAAVALLAFWVGSSALSDTASLASQGGETARALLGRLLGPRGLTLFGHAYSPGEIVAAAGRSLSDLFGPDTVARLVGTGIAAIAGGFLLVVLIPYFMISGPRLVAGAIWLIPPERRRAVQSVLPKILPVLRRYLLGVLVVVGYTAIVGWIGFGAVFGLPHAALLAIAIGVLEIVPVLGPVTAAALGALAGFQHAGLGGLAGLVAFIVALRLSIDNLVGPLVLGRAARIHPVVVIFAFVTGAMLFGAIGLLLAVPVAVTLKIALQHYYAEPIAAPRAER